eukprot:TRINITY_DN10165_c0_g1_i1.p1 TRINITY_DN10165_c0_g1~~TRINITY_DN10165_c0_g1_i1.p1  ORF type:complete len:335 (-),score=35.87 TRINITY_DN10165_c0_g1_i1:49-906(-)
MGFDLEYSQKLRTPLYEAVSKESLEICRTILEFKPPMNCTKNPLHIATKNGSIDIVRLLIEAGSDVNYVDTESARPTTALIISLKMKRKEIMELLLEAGADPNLVPKHSTSCPMTFAVQYGSSETLKRLLEHGGDPCDISLLSFDLSVDIMQLLLDWGADLHGSDRESILHQACSRNDIELVKLLFKYDALEAKAFDRYQRLHMWGAGRRMSAVRDVSALSKASEKGFSKIVSLLVLRGADRDEIAQTPLLQTNEAYEPEELHRLVLDSIWNYMMQEMEVDDKTT